MPTPDASEPLPEHAEALVGQLVETLAARQMQHGALSERSRTAEGAVALARKRFDAPLRDLARKHAAAWPHVAPLFVEGGPKCQELKTGEKPRHIALLRTLLEDWTPDRLTARPTNGRPAYVPVPSMTPDPYANLGDLNA